MSKLIRRIASAIFPDAGTPVQRTTTGIFPDVAYGFLLRDTGDFLTQHDGGLIIING